MTTPRLDRVTLATLDNYGRAAVQMVAAYRAGSRRVAAVVDGAFERSVGAGVEKLVPAAARRVDTVRRQVFDFVDQGIVQVADRSEQAIERSHELAAAQVKKVAEMAAAVTKPPMLVEGLRTAARLSLPGAEFALTVSGKVAEGADAIAKAAGATPAKAAARQARRTVATAKRGARRTTARAAKVVEAAKAPVRRARKAVAKVEKAAAAA